MLLVWDIHINPKFKEKIFEQLKSNILSTNQKNIIFLWDYVYHFVYDRKSLVELFNFFLELAVSYNKNIFVLSWNHDWINDVFVFEETKNLIEAIKWFDKIKFITQPIFEEIEWEKILFLPYNLKLNWEKVFKKYDLHFEINDEFDSLVDSSNKNEKYSWYLNRFLDQFLLKYWQNITVIHHFYTTDFSFIWQRWKFKFKDVAIFWKKFLNLENLRLISGHLHQGFSYKNYFCCGSVWATTPLESWQFKFIFEYNNWLVKPILIDINFYLPIEYERQFKIDEKILIDRLKNLFEETKKHYESDKFMLNWDNTDPTIDFKNIVLQIHSDNLDYDDLKTILDNDLFNKLKDVKIKRKSKISNKIVNLMIEEKEKLTTSFKSWKDLLKLYLEEKYWKESEKYLEVLRNLNIL